MIQQRLHLIDSLRPATSSGARLLLCATLALSAVTMFKQPAQADPSYIENLTFFDRSPSSPRPEPYAPALRLDANDSSFAGAAGWGGGFNTWQKQFDHTKSLVASHQQAGLLFIGDSLTQGWGNVNGRQANNVGDATWNSTQYNYNQYGALNLGIAGDQTQNVLYRIANGQLTGLNPGLVVLMIGTNNLYAPAGDPGFPILDYPAPAHTPEEIADGILATVQAIHTELPNAHILTLSALRGLNNSDPDRIAMNNANSLVSQAFTTDTNSQLHYLDFTSGFRNPNGTINGNMSGDGIHLTPAGYNAWAAAIAPFVGQYAKLDLSAQVLNVAPLGSANWTNSVDGSFGHFASRAIDGDLSTMIHSDFDGSFGGNPARPDVFTITLDQIYDLKNVEIVNRGALDNGSGVSDARLNGVLLEVIGANGSDVLFSTSLTDDPVIMGETLSFDNNGQGFAGAKFIRLTSNNFLHVREIRANVTIVPEPTTSLLGIGLAGVCALIRPNR